MLNRWLIGSLLLVALLSCRREAQTETEAVASAEPMASTVPSASVAPAPSAAPVVVQRPLLWEVQTAGGKSYLFGTMHVGVEADHLPRVVWAKINEATT